MTIQEAFAVLRVKFGPDRECARFVGMSPQHYEALRNGRANIPQRTAEYILLKAAEVEGACEPSFSFTSASPTSALAPVHQEVRSSAAPCTQAGGEA